MTLIVITCNIESFPNRVPLWIPSHIVRPDSVLLQVTLLDTAGQSPELLQAAKVRGGRYHNVDLSPTRQCSVPRVSSWSGDAAATSPLVIPIRCRRAVALRAPESQWLL